MQCSSHLLGPAGFAPNVQPSPAGFARRPSSPAGHLPFNLHETIIWGKRHQIEDILLPRLVPTPGWFAFQKESKEVDSAKPPIQTGWTLPSPMLVHSAYVHDLNHSGPARQHLSDRLFWVSNLPENEQNTLEKIVKSMWIASNKETIVRKSRSDTPSLGLHSQMALTHQTPPSKEAKLGQQGPGGLVSSMRILSLFAKPAHFNIQYTASMTYLPVRI